MKLGVIIARFQVPDLHPAHHILIGHAMRNSDQLLIFLGTSAGGATNHNPLDFKTRQALVNHHYPKAMVMPLRDQPSDFTWSRILDEKISEVTKEGDEVTLFCGRDGFKSHYVGKHKKRVQQIEAIPEYSGTALRQEARRAPKDTVDFREGVIYGVGNRYPNTFMTVDIAVIKREGDQNLVLMGRRPNEGHWRFPGGFVDFADKSLEGAARRELFEECGVEVAFEHDLHYVASLPIDDWRYRARPDARILTSLFAVKMEETSGDPTPDGEEFEEFTYFDIDKATHELIVSEHKPVYMALSRYLSGNAKGVSGPVKKQKVSV